MNTPSRIRVVLFVLLAIALALGGQAAAPSRAQGKTELVYGISNNVDTLDPNVTTFSSVNLIMLHVFDPLVWQQPLGTFQPGLATEWTISEDATEYTFKLRQGVTFHDGTPFNAAAVKFTWDRIANPDTKSQSAFSLLGPYKESVVVDEYTIKVSFTRPFAPFLNSVSSALLAPTSPTAVETLGAEYGKSMVVGTGPFKLASYTPDSEVVLVRNPDYNWGGKLFGMEGPAKLEKITFKIIQDPATRVAALEAGEVDFIDNVPGADVARLKDDPNLTVLEIEQPGHGWSLMMNVEREPTSELAVRKAMAQAIDKQGMIDTVFNGFGTPACTFLTKVMFGFDPKSCEYLPYDPAAAAKTLDEAGWKMGADGIRERNGAKLVVQHYYRADSALNVAMATYMKAELAKVGIDMNLNGLARAGYFDAVRSGQHNTQHWWDTGTDPDLVRVLLYSANANGGTNRNRYKNPKMDELIDAAAGTADPEKRKALYAELQKFVADEAVMIFFVDPMLLYAQVKSLEGVQVLGGGNLMNFYGASFK